MISEHQALRTVRAAVANYLRDAITQGEAMSDVIAALEDCQASRTEERSWAPAPGAGPSDTPPASGKLT